MPDISTDMLAPMDDTTPEQPSVPHVDPFPDVRTALKKRRIVEKELESLPGVKVRVQSMRAADRAEWVASISTIVDDDGKMGNLHPLNKQLVSSCVLAPDSDEPLFATLAEWDDVDGSAMDELITLCQEVSGLATASQKVSTEEEVAVKD